jgi:hypothetical protein
MKIKEVDGFSGNFDKLTLKGYIYCYKYNEPSIGGTKDTFDNTIEKKQLYDYTLTADMEIDNSFREVYNETNFNNYWKDFYNSIQISEEEESGEYFKFRYCMNVNDKLSYIYDAKLSNIQMEVNFADPFIKSLSNTDTTRWIFKYL